MALHLEEMHASSPPGHVFALDLSDLRASTVTVWSARHCEEVYGIGALKQIDESVGEVKSMRTPRAPWEGRRCRHSRAYH
jgi:putative acetyltransferase